MKEIKNSCFDIDFEQACSETRSDSGIADLDEQLDRYLRCLMLFQTYCKLRVEAEKFESVKLGLNTEMTVTSKTNIGNILDLNISLTFFKKSVKERPSEEIVSAKYFK